MEFSDLNNLPIYEPGLDHVVGQVRNKFIFFNEIDSNIINSEMILFQLIHLRNIWWWKRDGIWLEICWICARKIAEVAKTDKIVGKINSSGENRSTIKKIFEETGSGVNFDILSNPEFLVEGTAMRDLEVPDRVLIVEKLNLVKRQLTHL